ncbi:isochorismatase [Lasiosphaeris hirsuta]|uniref:Isochorismatase n=1 Tax=Lasiosphaeris hirsuta TaxID=260670 RepID=A0AA40ART2_9PEZI|nr:isochorismatase [Lasiosphaeris hirsuta]
MTPQPPSQVVGNADTSFWLFNASTGYDLTHPSTPTSPPVVPRLRLATTNDVAVAIAPAKTALIVIDMQNFFLSEALGRVRGEGHEAETTLLSTAFPAARAAGIQIVHVIWGIEDAELGALPPTLFRAFGSYRTAGSAEIAQGKGEVRSYDLGEDVGPVELGDGESVPGGRLLMRDQWNTALHGPLQKSFDESQSTALPDHSFWKNRLSGFWGGSTPVVEFLRKKGITTLLFTGVNTDQCVFSSLQDSCNLGFDTVLLSDGCGTRSPSYATQMVLYNCERAWGFVSSCKALAEGVKSMAWMAGNHC